MASAGAFPIICDEWLCDQQGVPPEYRQLDPPEQEIVFEPVPLDAELIGNWWALKAAQLELMKAAARIERVLKGTPLKP